MIVQAVLITSVKKRLTAVHGTVGFHPHDAGKRSCSAVFGLQISPPVFDPQFFWDPSPSLIPSHFSVPPLVEQFFVGKISCG